MKIHFTSCEPGPAGWQHQDALFRKIWELSGRRHALVEAPAEADLIFVGNIRNKNWFSFWRKNPVINHWPEKCFALCDMWELLPLLRGIYVNAHTRLPFAGRFRSGAYTLYHPDFLNPFAENHPGRAWELPKKYLATFAGRDCHPARAALFRARFARADVLVRDTSAYNAFTFDGAGKEPRQREYVELLESSKFAICPRGVGAASIRLFEAMRMGVAPVIVSDDWILPAGPDWSKCALRLPERDAGRIEALLEENEARHAEIARAAREAYERFFAPEVYFDYLVEQALDIRRRQRIPEAWFWKLRHAIVFAARVRGRWRRGFLRKSM